MEYEAIRAARRTLIGRVRVIPGISDLTAEQAANECVGSFWKYGSEESYVKAAHRLSELGMCDDEIVTLLESLYFAAANCYGG